jgi:AICAR transformylase/IMP cyclohydrolase PurH
MSTSKKIQSALISVFSKEGLEPIIVKLNALGVKLYLQAGQKLLSKVWVLKLQELKKLHRTRPFWVAA